MTGGNEIYRTFLYISLTTIISGQCIDKNHNISEIIYDQTYPAGELLTYENNVGLTLCVDACANLGGCSHMNYNPETLSCALMADNDNLTISGLKENGTEMTKDIGNVFVLMNSLIVVCGTKVCRDGYTCVETASGKKTCIQAVKYCREERYLVTGPYGVKSDRVTFSTVFPHPDNMTSRYMLDSTFGWFPAVHDRNQWIQVTFHSLKLVRGIVTQGSGRDYLRWITSYHVKYNVKVDEWEYVKDTSGSILVFSGTPNGGPREKKVNYFPSPIRTTGVQLRPQIWTNDYIEMRFDVLGC